MGHLYSSVDRLVRPSGCPSVGWSVRFFIRKQEMTPKEISDTELDTSDKLPRYLFFYVPGTEKGTDLDFCPSNQFCPYEGCSCLFHGASVHGRHEKILFYGVVHRRHLVEKECG